MKTIIIYKSGTGFTKKYALWLENELGIKAYTLKEAKKNKLMPSLIIYGGWVMGGIISGLKDTMKKFNCEIIPFAVGASPKELVDLDYIRKTNEIAGKLFYMQGGMNYDNLNFLFRKMMKMMSAGLEKKEDKTELEKYMASHLGSSFDAANVDYIAELVEYVQNNYQVQ